MPLVESVCHISQEENIVRPHTYTLGLVERSGQSLNPDFPTPEGQARHWPAEVDSVAFGGWSEAQEFLFAQH